MSERLQKLMAQAGIASRRASEKLISAGRVKVNGRVASLGQSADPGVDTIEVDGKVLRLDQALLYYVLNKPGGYITTLDDPQGRPTVAEFLPDDAPRLFPVGRLDKDTEGLLLFTNDGKLAHRLLHPSRGVRKTYRVKVEGEPTVKVLRRLEAGVELDDGRTAPCKIRKFSSGWLEMILKEGRKRQIRRMLELVGHPVVALKRVRFGPLELGNMRVGEMRALNQDEIQALRKVTR